VGSGREEKGRASGVRRADRKISAEGRGFRSGWTVGGVSREEGATSRMEGAGGGLGGRLEEVLDFDLGLGWGPAW
jgi:hypothetical protein